MDAGGEEGGKSKAIISSLCWVDRGYAKAQLEEYNPTDEQLKASKKYAKQMLKGQELSNVEIGEAKNMIEQNLDD